MKVVIIGGGPAGMMAGISSANSGDDVCILEKNEKLGRKLLITGKGRCNITSSLEMKDFIANVPGNGRFLYSCFENFTNQDIIAMLKKQGVAVKEERGNRIFPVSDKSMDVLRAFEKELNEKLKQERIDVTLPGKYTQMGRVHPLTSTTNEITAIFQSLGFSVVPQANAPEVETEYFNFDALNVPKDHPARDVQDTFYTEIAKNVVLRSQTSNAQIHAMEGKNPPIRIISPGRVYRNENINARKNNFFHQIEGLYVDKDITFGDLKGVLNEFIRTYFGASRPTRFRSSFFPFTEPSAEVDVQCIMCEGKGCRTCSGTGWLEVLGCGMVDPNVLRGVGIDPDVYTGFAFGMGVERLAMLKYAIDDIRLFFNDDVRFLKQF